MFIKIKKGFLFEVEQNYSRTGWWFYADDRSFEAGILDNICRRGFISRGNGIVGTTFFGNLEDILLRVFGADSYVIVPEDSITLQ